MTDEELGALVRPLLRWRGARDYDEELPHSPYVQVRWLNRDNVSCVGIAEVNPVLAITCQDDDDDWDAPSYNGIWFCWPGSNSRIPNVTHWRPIIDIEMEDE